MGLRPLNISVEFVELTGDSPSGPAADVRLKQLIARILSDDFIRGAGARLSICVTGVTGADGEGWRRARSSCTAGSAVSARGSLDKAEIARRYSPFSEHALERVHCELRDLRGSEEGCMGRSSRNRHEHQQGGQEGPN